MNTKPSKTSGVVSKTTGKSNKTHEDSALDEALAESFPSSDPIAVTVSKRKPQTEIAKKRAPAKQPSKR